MPSVSIELQSLLASGPLIDILIAPSKPVIDLMLADNQPVPQPIRLIALINTGASSTVIKSGIAARLQLQPRGGYRHCNPIVQWISV